MHLIESSSHRSDEIAVIAAPLEREATVANLLELYAHDFSEYLEVPLGNDGRFGYKNLSSYWTLDGWCPFLIERNGSLAGLALVRRGSRITGDSNVWDMSEFFVTRGHRRGNVGARAAGEIWRRFPGKWEVRVTSRNPPALAFWKSTVSKFVGKPIVPTLYEERGTEWNLFAFESGSAS